METNDLAVILSYAQFLFPQEFARLSAVYPPRMVMLLFFERHEDDMFKILKMLFTMSEEYKTAVTYINSLTSDKPER